MKKKNTGILLVENRPNMSALGCFIFHCLLFPRNGECYSPPASGRLFTHNEHCTSYIAPLTSGSIVLLLELELIQAHMAQKPVLRVEVSVRALRVRSVSREEAWASAGVQSAWVSG